MPYAAKPMLDDENQKQNEQNGVNISGGGGANFATGVPGQESSGASNKRSSGQYANIQSYLDVNRDQADQMGGKIAADVGTKAEDAQNRINDFSSKAPTVQAYDPNEAINNAQSLTAEQKAQYQQNRNTGGYAGPATVDKVEGYGDTQSAASKAASAVKNAGTESGQQQLLKETYSKPSYSQGQNRLDQVLLQNSAGSKQALEGVTNKYADLDKLFSTAETNVGNAINSATTQANENKKAFIPAEQAAVKSLLDPIQQRAADANKNNSAYIDRILADASDLTLNEETLGALGLQEGQRVFGLNLNNYINQDRTQVGINNAANADERAKYAALASLFNDQSMQQITADGKAISPVGFNREQYENDLRAAQDAFNNYAAGTQINKDVQNQTFVKNQSSDPRYWNKDLGSITGTTTGSQNLQEYLNGGVNPGGISFNFDANKIFGSQGWSDPGASTYMDNAKNEMQQRQYQEILKYLQGESEKKLTDYGYYNTIKRG